MAGSSASSIDVRTPGPATLLQAVEWPWDFFAGLPQQDAQRALDKLQAGVVLTSSFSGVGGAETALACLVAAAKGGDASDAPRPASPSPAPRPDGVWDEVLSASSLSVEEDDEVPDLVLEADDDDKKNDPIKENVVVVMYSATDNDQLCRQALLAHPHESTPQHVFRDVLERVPDDVLARLKAIESSKLKTMPARRRSACIDERIQKCELGAELVAGLRKELESTRFNETVWCVRHNAYCHVHPRSDASLAGFMHLEVAGPCCPAWSSMSARQDRWLSQATLPALVWAYSARHAGVDIIVHENAPGWDEEPTRQIFAGEANGARRRSNCVGSMYGPGASVFGCYQPPPLCPTMFGRPSRRKRKYTMFIRRHGFHLALPPVTTFAEAFEQAFVRAQSLGMVEYLCAPEPLVLDHAEQLVRDQGFDMDATEIDAGMAVRSGEAVRSFGYQRLAESKGLVEDGVWNCPVALVNLAQASSHIKQVDTANAPALMTRSILFDLVRQRMLVDEEYWLIQGYAPPRLLHSRLEHLFPARELHLSSKQARHLAGNGMHLTCVGSMILAALAFTERAE